jgi:hypothetical protein
MLYTLKMHKKTLPIGSIVNIHKIDGVSTGGQEFVGMCAFTASDQRMPELVLRSCDKENHEESIRLDQVLWIDTLGTLAFEERREPAGGS